MPRFAQPRRAYAPVPAGSHAAWLIHYIDRGTQFVKSEQYGDKNKRMGRLVFEIPGERMADGRPMTIGMNMPLNGHENGNLRKSISAWTSRSFTDESFAEYDERELFSLPCLINVIHKKDSQGGVFAYVGNIQALPKGMQVDPPTNEYIYVSLDREKFVAEELDKLPHLLSAKMSAEYMQQIQSSPEWQELFAQPEPDGSDDEVHEMTQDDLDGEAPADFAESEDPAPPQARPAPRPAPAPAARPAPAPQRPAAPPRHAAAAPQRPAPQAAPQRPQAPARSAPAPAAPAPRPGGVSQRAMGAPAARPAPQQARPAARPAPVPQLQQDIGDEVPY